MIVQAITKAVPIGEASALSSKEIWQAVGEWGQKTIASRLAIMACRGEIHERAAPALGFGRVKYVYWREASV